MEGLRYRTKNVEIEAIIVQVGYRNLTEIIAFVGEDNLCPIERHPNYILKIKTLEGNMSVSYGDYIIKGLIGEVYPCKPDAFEMKYELVKAEAAVVGDCLTVYDLQSIWLPKKQKEVLLTHLNKKVAKLLAAQHEAAVVGDWELDV